MQQAHPRHRLLGHRRATSATTPSSAPPSTASPSTRPTWPWPWPRSTPTSSTSTPTANTACPLADFHRLPGDEPAPRHHAAARRARSPPSSSRPPPDGAHSTYRKVRDRASYAFALASVAAELVIDDGIVSSARIALGGVAHKPWRAHLAEQALVGAARHRGDVPAGRRRRTRRRQNRCAATNSRWHSPGAPSSPRCSTARGRTPAMTLVEPRAIGTRLTRLDGPAKVTGTAPYAYEHQVDAPLYLHPVQATIARGRITAMDTSEARRRSTACVAILTVFDAPDTGRHLRRRPRRSCRTTRCTTAASSSAASSPRAPKPPATQPVSSASSTTRRPTTPRSAPTTPGSTPPSR